MYLTIARSTAGWICDRSCVGYLTLSLSLSLSLRLPRSLSLSLSPSLSVSLRLSPSLPSLPSLSLSRSLPFIEFSRSLSLYVSRSISVFACMQSYYQDTIGLNYSRLDPMDLRGLVFGVTIPRCRTPSDAVECRARHVYPSTFIEGI